MSCRSLQRGVVAAALCLGVACGDMGQQDSVTAPASAAVVLEFTARVGNDVVQFDRADHPHSTAAGNSYRVEVLQYYISDVVLHVDGQDHLIDVVHYVDGEDPDTWELHLEDVPAGHLHSIRFTFGLDEEKNVAGKSYPGASLMGWPCNWGSGYHYMKLEGFVLDGSGVSRGFKTHTGRLGDDVCTGKSFGAPGIAVEHHHYFEATVETHMDTAVGQTSHVEVVMDLNQWYEGPHVIDLNDHTTGIMNNTPMQDLLEANGASVFRAGQIDAHEHP